MVKLLLHNIAGVDFTDTVVDVRGTKVKLRIWWVSHSSEMNLFFKCKYFTAGTLQDKRNFILSQNNFFVVHRYVSHNYQFTS